MILEFFTLENALQILIFILLITVLINQFRIRGSRHKISTDEYLALTHSIDEAVQDYKIHFFDPRVQALSNSLDLDPSSQTNAIQTYNRQYKELIDHCCRDFLKRYISKDQRRIASYYFTADSLSIYVLSKFKGNR